jgi:predicted tellurium resistance membrane protein TerC
LGLVNKDIEWKAWQSFRTSVLNHLVYRDVHDRYEYGELRLGRLDQICRMKFLGLSYFNVHRDYSSYFGDNYMTLVALFALVSVALSAMQVMTSVDSVPAAVSVTSYRFAIATLIALAGSCAALLVLYIGLYVWNWLLIFVRRYSQQRKR